jgi:hypothetical protein
VSVNPASSTIPSGGNKKVAITYSVSAPGGTVRLTATGQSGGDSAYDITTVSTNPTLNLIVPVLTSGSRAVVRTRQPRILATYTPSGAGIDTTKTVVSWKRSTDAAPDTVTHFRADSLAIARQNHGLAEFEVDSARWLAVGDSALITATACGQDALCTTVSRWAVLPNDSTPVLSFAGAPLEALGRQFGTSFGPGLAVSGGELETGIAIPAYVSMGAGRATGLVYSTRQAYPRALVLVDLELPWPSGTPDTVKLVLIDASAGVHYDSLTLSGPTCATGATTRCRAVLQRRAAIRSKL